MIGTYFRGRLGNNMYQYVHIRSTSERLGLDFSIHESDQGNFSQFDDIFPHLDFKRNEGKFQNKLEEHNYDFKENFYNLVDGTISYGFFQNHMYSNREECKEWFKINLNDEQQKEYDDIYDKYNPNDYCYMNFRGTDFMDVPSWQTDKIFFNDAKDVTKKNKFLVITDDIKNAKLNIKADGYIAPNYKIALKLMVSSKNLIIPAWSSFAFWGGWLSDADLIIAPDIDDICYNKNEIFKYI